VDSEDEGLRSRKKRDTRRRIAMAAMALFVEHGFDAVTVAQVAHAADVSEKTVFNYFPTKEDLALARFEPRIEALITALSELPPEVSIVEPFRDMTLGFLDMAEFEPVDRTLALYRLIMSSRTLEDRLRRVWEEETARLTPVVAQALGTDPADLVPAVVARALTGAHRTLFRAAVRRLVDGEDRSVVAQDLREQTDRAYDRLADGLRARRSP
jgi:AcrR family transcriptional regulator